MSVESVSDYFVKTEQLYFGAHPETPSVPTTIMELPTILMRPYALKYSTYSYMKNAICRVNFNLHVTVTGSKIVKNLRNKFKK